MACAEMDCSHGIGYMITWLRQLFCRHSFDLEKRHYWGATSFTAPCFKCGKRELFEDDDVFLRDSHECDEAMINSDGTCLICGEQWEMGPADEQSSRM